MEQPPKLLAVDTSGRGARLAILEGGAVVARRAHDGRPAEGLLRALTRLLDEAGWALRDLGLVVVGVGPGSFTGTRVGLATAKGLALAAGVEVVGVDSLAARARSVGGSEVALLVDAGRGEVYGGAFRCEAGPAVPLRAPFLARPARALELLGDLRPVLADSALGLDLPPAPALDAGALGLEGWLRYQARGGDDPARLEPNYVRTTDATLPDQPLKIDQASPSSSVSSSKRDA